MSRLPAHAPRYRALAEVLWPAAALALALASWVVLLSGDDAAPVLAALTLGLVTWRVLVLK